MERERTLEMTDGVWRERSDQMTLQRQSWIVWQEKELHLNMRAVIALSFLFFRSLHTHSRAK